MESQHHNTSESAPVVTTFLYIKYKS